MLLLKSTRLLFLIVVTHSLVACAADLQQSKTKPLRFIAAVEIPNNAKQDSFRIGGLSSATYIAENNELLAICDDTGLNLGPRIHHFNLSLNADSLSVTSKKVTRLTNAQGAKVFPKQIIDAEALVVMPSGNYLVASEGIDVNGYFALPGLIEFLPDGRYFRNWPVPSKFLPLGEKMIDTGVRSNDAFESLSMTTDNKILFMANEKAMIQDGPIPDLQTESPIRIIQYDPQQHDSLSLAEYVYHVSPLGRVNNSSETTGFRSVSDFMALNSKEILVLEKTFFTGPIQKNSVQIFLAEIDAETTNVSGINSIRGKDYTPLNKKLLIDLDQFEGTENFPDLDNMEGITFGPDLPNGNKTLILLTDNNFTHRQKTLIYAFEVLAPQLD